MPWQDAPYPPRRWQREALPVVMRELSAGRRPIIRACTGAGKSYLIAEISRLAESRGRRVVIAVPTEALVEQTASAVSGRCSSVARWYGRRKERGAVTVCCYPSLGSWMDEAAAQGWTVDLLLCDECHGTEAESRQADVEAVGARWRVGLTATPYRSDEAAALTAWDGVAYEYGLDAAMADGVLVPLVVREPVVDRDTLVDDALQGMYGALPTRPDTGRVRPGVVTCASVDDAEMYADRLRADGWRVEPVHYRRSRSDVDAAIERLRVGELDMLTHVSMLSEGVDLPWLWWLALRRPLGSRVALVQSVGRVLRVDREDPDKTAGYVLDPHGVCASVGLVHEAAVGERTTPDETPDAPREARDSDEESVPMTLEGRRVRVRASEAERLWREMAVGLEVRGLLQPGVARGRWSRKPATDDQRAALERMSWATRHLPDEHRETWRALAKCQSLSRGCASDMLDIIRIAADGGRDARQRRQRWVLPMEVSGE